ncbi:hypothetical protein llg_40400 [Luteolibacter sp. LG18]|nr:hypothetical protein llg_40400 [Luteolibacter sp. LG18]
MARPVQPAPPVAPWKPWAFLWFLFWLGCGVVGNFIEWGDPAGFHGTGWPLAHVMWDRPRGGDRLVDYVNPCMAGVNIAAALLVGGLLWWIGKGISRLKR